MSQQQRGRVVLLAVLGVFRSLAETISTGAVLPYMYVLIDPEKAKTLPVLKGIYTISNGDEMKFIISSTLLFIILYALRCAYLVIYDYIVGRVIRKISSDYSVRLFRYYMTRPYDFFFNKNTSLLQRNVTSVISSLMQGVISNSLYLLSHVMTIIMLLCIMIFSGISGLLFASAVLGCIYLVLSRYAKQKAKSIAAEANAHSKTLHKTILECFRGIKDVKLSADESKIADFVSGEYDAANELRAKRILLNSVPNQILELGTVGILVIILISGYKNNGMEESLAMLSLCGASAIRIRSALSGILSKIMSIKDNSAYYDEVIDDIKESRKIEFEYADKESIVFDKSIEISNITYRYPNTDNDIFKDFSMSINKGESIGISGHSGKGKSTLADLLTGLLKPDCGDILIDGVSLKGHEAAWRNSVGYVPQDIFLLDGTVAENIALFEPKNSIDKDRINKALKMAQILDFVDTLPNKEDSLIGDNGILLSGGQRQRIGIARALYRDPEVLLFDEATNSLDSETENAFIDTISSLKDKYTIIIISHNSQTLKRCDRVIDINM